MACGIEHWYVCDFALRRQTWYSPDLGYGGWQAHGQDPYNRIATFPDAVADWLWQKPPWVSTSIDYGLGKARRDWQRGDMLSAAAKLALVSHYVADSLAVSHTWLDFIGDESDADGSDTFHLFHDPVENPVGEYIQDATPVVPARPADARQYLADATLAAYRIGRQIFEAFFAGEPVRPWVLEGAKRSAEACWVVFDMVTRATPSATSAVELRRAESEWVMAPLFDMSGEDLLRECSGPKLLAQLKERLGYQGGDIFCRLDRCAPHARQAAEQWRADRRRWRAIDMATILPPAPTQTITADWRPERDPRFGA